MVDYLKVENSGELVYREYARHAAVPGPSLSVGATRPAPPNAKFGGSKTSLQADGASATTSARSEGKTRALPESLVESAQAQASGSRRSDHDEEAMAVGQEEDPRWRLYGEYQQNKGKKDKGKGRALPKPLPEQNAHAQTKKRKARASEAEPTRAAGLHEEHGADGWGTSASSGPSRQAKRPKTTHDVAESVLDQMRRELDDEPVLPWQRGAPRTLDKFPPLRRISSSRSPSYVYRPPSSPVQAPPPSSSPAPTQLSSRSTPAIGIRRKGVPDADVIIISSDSEDDDRMGTGTAGRKQTDEQLERWMQLPPFNNQPSLYSQRKAASSRGSVASTTRDDEQDERGDWDIDDDPWAEIGTQFSHPRVQASSSSRRAQLSQLKPGTGKRSYREMPVPSSSQESVL